MIIEELKQRLLAKSLNIKRCGDIIPEYRQNQMLAMGQKKIIKEPNGRRCKTGWRSEKERLAENLEQRKRT